MSVFGADEEKLRLLEARLTAPVQLDRVSVGVSKISNQVRRPNNTIRSRFVRAFVTEDCVQRQRQDSSRDKDDAATLSDAPPQSPALSRESSRSSVRSRRRKSTPRKHSPAIHSRSSRQQTPPYHSGLRSRENSRHSRGARLNNSRQDLIGTHSNGGNDAVNSPSTVGRTLHAYFAPKGNSSRDPQVLTETNIANTISPKIVSTSVSLKRKTPSTTATSGTEVAQVGRGSSSKRSSAQKKSRKRLVVQQKRQGNKKGEESNVRDASTTLTAQQKLQQRYRNAAVDEVNSLKDEVESMQESMAFMQEKLEHARRAIKEGEEKLKAQRNGAAKIFEKIMRKNATKDALDARENLAKQSVRLGKVVVVKTGGLRRGGAAVSEMWRDGHAFKQLHKKMAALIEKKDRLEKQRRELAKAARRARVEFKKKATERQSQGSLHQDEAAVWIPPLEHVVQEEVIKVALSHLKREEVTIAQERKKLESEKKLHIRELKRVRDEDQSRFNKLPVLNNRYLLMKLLGKGGFSEVWEAFDLHEYTRVACKIHQLNAHWSDEKKQNYTKHATREYAIHKSVRHDRVVRLFDVFEIDMVSFATVLECCEGPDLDYYLKELKTLPEREARAILVQIISALAYLNGREHPIIHYDLKPANILFDGSAAVKITDFGLSKIMDGDGGNGGAGTHGIELTSQGAGTYWYLPPECFRTGPSPPKISSKVDVWSVGVIFYQMLFGKRPFGDGMSQEMLLTEQTILNAREVKFPDNVKISDVAKDFIRQCLKYHAHSRPDVLKLSKHPYLRQRKL